MSDFEKKLEKLPLRSPSKALDGRIDALFADAKSGGRHFFPSAAKGRRAWIIPALGTAAAFAVGLWALLSLEPRVAEPNQNPFSIANAKSSAECGIVVTEPLAKDFSSIFCVEKNEACSYFATAKADVRRLGFHGGLQ